MSTTPANLAGSAAALARFDAARDAFLAAFAQAPDAALAYVPEGDEYAVGTLVAHLADPMRRYLEVFALIQSADFGPVDFSADAERTAREARRHAELVAMRPTGTDRSHLLADMDAAHRDVHATLATLDDATYTRQAPVIYSTGAAPYPTSFEDILGWLTDHYDEHTTQVGELLARWRG